MLKKLIALIVLIALLIAFSGCIEEEEKTPLEEYVGVEPEPVLEGTEPIVEGIIETGVEPVGEAWLPEAISPEIEQTTLNIKASGLKLVLYPTIAGEVKTENELGRIEVNVEEFIPKERLKLSYKIKTETGDQSGVLESNGLNLGYKQTFPYFWENITTKTDSTLIWLSNNNYENLREFSDTDILIEFFDQTPAWYKTEAATIFTPDVSRLRIPPSKRELVEFQVKVNGVEQSVQAFEAIDDIRNEYLILDNPENPLILKLTYNRDYFPSKTKPSTINELREKAGFQVTEIFTQ